MSEEPGVDGWGIPLPDETTVCVDQSSQPLTVSPPLRHSTCMTEEHQPNQHTNSPPSHSHRCLKELKHAGHALLQLLADVLLQGGNVVQQKGLDNSGGVVPDVLGGVR